MLGRQSYIVRGIHSVNRRNMMPLLLPLSLVDIEVTDRPRATLQQIKDLHVYSPFLSIPFDPIKRPMAIFIAELLQKAIQSSEQDSQLFDFISSSIRDFDKGIEGQANFHLYFMSHIAMLLGFEPDISNRNFQYFDMINGTMIANRPFHNHFLEKEDLQLWIRLLSLDYCNLSLISFTRVERQRIIEMLEQYYMLHITGFTQLKSYAVLHQLF